MYQAVAASISSCLNVQIEVSNKDYKVYMDALNAKPTKLTFGAISYGMDYLDPSNMLGIWISTGRHSWKNDQFDKMVNEASSMTGDPEKRHQMFKDAEKILVDDVGGIFIDHRWVGDLFQPYIQGRLLPQARLPGHRCLALGQRLVLERLLRLQGRSELQDVPDQVTVASA